MARETYRTWTADEDAALREMVGDGTLDREIAVELGRTVRSVASRRRALRRSNRWDARYLRKAMAGRPLKVDRRLEVLAMLERGLTVSDVARALGTKASPLCRFLKRMEQDDLVRRVPVGTGRQGRWEAVPDNDTTDQIANPARTEAARARGHANEPQGDDHGED